jgi:DNA-binding transcriptional MerR regulator
VSSRAYLSIGDVLTLLREEFPDVTISKIRFLESQGLVNPERSPSGYRKFFEHDVERLRWVLRQQREHFLPLKVIRDRLASGDLAEGPETVDGAAPAAEAVKGNGRAAQPPAHAAVGAAAATNGGSRGRHEAGSTSLRSVASVGSAGESAGDDEPLTKADTDAMARILADASRRTARLPEGSRPALRAVPDGPEFSGGALAAPEVPEPPAAPATRAERPTVQPAPVTADGATAAAPRAARTATDPTPSRPAASAPPAAAAGTKAAVAAITPPARTEGTKTTGRSAAAPTAPSAAMSGMVTGASLTAEELCGASGLSEVELASLEGFGLIASTEVAGLATYDEDALTVANLAAELRVFGIEPRHLRLYKNAVDREVGLIEQVIIPLLRQRNPESRQRALDSADHLAALGQTMRATLLRSALRRHVGG